MVKKVELIQISQAGEPERTVEPLPDAIRGICGATAAFHQRIGFDPPWVGYITVCKG